MTELVTLQVKRGTISEWISRNPILAQGELGFESDTGQLKIGNGTTVWNSLSYISGKVGPISESTTLGKNAGATGQGNNTVAIGYLAGNERQGVGAVAVGSSAGRYRQSDNAVAVGYGAGTTTQGVSAVAVGTGSGVTNQGRYAVAVGFDAGWSGQGESSIAIGSAAGYLNQPRNSIILNASGSTLNAGQTGAFYVRPIRQDITKRIPLSYDPTTYEIVQGTTYTWLQPATSFTSIFTTTSQAHISDLNISSLEDARYYLELLPANDIAVIPPIVTLRDRTLSTIIEKINTRVFGGTTSFLDINNYITVTSHPSESIPIIRVIIVSSLVATREKFALNLRKINY